MKNFFELSARFSKQQSFYGKAHIIIEDNDTLTLRSYETDIINLDPKAHTFKKLYSEFSQTTNRHIKEFAKQYGLPICKWSDFDKLEMNTAIKF